MSLIQLDHGLIVDLVLLCLLCFVTCWRCWPW